MIRWVIAVTIVALCQIPIEGTATGLGTKHAGPKVTQPKSSQVICGPFAEAKNQPKPAPQIDQHAVDRIQHINKAVQTQPHSILFLGDSLTEDWDPTIWQQYFAGRAPLNAGIQSDRTEHLLWRLLHGNLDGPSPHGVVLLIGTNDVGRNRPAEVIAQGTRANLEVLRSRFPNTRVLLLGLLPRSQSPDSPRRQQIRHVNRLIQKCADGQYVFYADLGGSLLDTRGRLSPETSPEGVNLRQQGYAVLSRRLKIEIDRVLGGGRP